MRIACFLIADQREIDPPLDIRAQQTDLFQVLNVQGLRGFFFQKPVDLKQLGLHERDHLVHEPVLFFNLRALTLQFIFCLDSSFSSESRALISASCP